MAPKPTIIDCDPGTDDAIALWLALASPELDVRLVTVAGGNVGLEATTANARAVIGLTGRAVPVVAGAERSLLADFRAEPAVHGTDGLGGVRLPDGPPLTPGIAADAIRDLLRAAAPDSVTVIGLGPVTNLALALATEPALAGRIAEIVLMTGAWSEGNITPAAEFNAWNDPEALAMLLNLGRPLAMATLDLTAQAFVTPDLVARMAERPGGACWQAALAILRALPASKRFGHRGYPLHDPCAVAWAIAPALFGARHAHAEVDLGSGPSRGRTVVDRWNRLGRPANHSLLETLDAPAFFDLLAARIAALP
ncbi:cysteine hydrolase [Falsiroseomonas bella]|uniref:Cysteine hydrolase n=1 Tax=Falsiroseomonas bella TaxID=2184016 RepID=A0A317F6S3_9PROT|nr:nucleoside hydrolase [Falsiroseomonas bella]PWS34724.1 cysteine hydrolase [Falsiroseomonas bella]